MPTTYIEITKPDDIQIGDYGCYPSDYFHYTWLVCGTKDWRDPHSQGEILPYSVFMDWVRSFRTKHWDNKGFVIIDTQNDHCLGLYQADDAYGVIKLIPKTGKVLLWR